MVEYVARVESVDGPSTLCVSMEIGACTVARRVKVRNVFPRDSVACWRWLEQMIGHTIFCTVDRTDRVGHYVCDIDWDGQDVAAMMIEEGIAD